MVGIWLTNVMTSLLACFHYKSKIIECMRLYESNFLMNSNSENCG